MKSISWSIILLVLLVAVTSCSSASIQPSEIMSPTAIVTAKPSVTFTVTKTWTPLPTLLPTLRVTPAGTPLPYFFNIPIPVDAIAGDGDASNYSFISRQSLISISSYYQQVLPEYGFVIQQVDVLDGSDNAPKYLAISFNPKNAPWQGIIFIRESIGDGLTWIDINIFTTD